MYYRIHDQSYETNLSRLITFASISYLIASSLVHLTFNAGIKPSAQSCLAKFFTVDFNF
jgi:hypothetical protein